MDKLVATPGIAARTSRWTILLWIDPPSIPSPSSPAAHPGHRLWTVFYNAESQCFRYLQGVFHRRSGYQCIKSSTEKLKMLFLHFSFCLPGTGWKLTCLAAFSRIARLLKRGPSRPVVDHQVKRHETYFPTQRPQARSHPRFPCSHGHQERPSSPVASPRQGPQASDRLILQSRW